MATSSDSVIKQLRMQTIMPFHAKPLVLKQQTGETIDWDAEFAKAEEEVFSLLDNTAHVSVTHYLQSLSHGEVQAQDLSSMEIESLVRAMQSAAASSSLKSYDLFCYLYHASLSSESLLKAIYEARQPDDHLTDLHWAVICQQDTSDITSVSIQPGTRTPLHYAVVLENAVALQQILEQFPETQNVQDDAARSLVYMAASMGACNLLDILIGHGADIHLSGGPEKLEPVFLACLNGHSDAAAKLIDAGANIHDNGVLHVAAEHGFLSIVSKLIAAGARVDDLTKGVSALFQAVQFNHYDVVWSLLKAGANVNLQNLGMTATEMATQKGYIEILTLLHEANMTNLLDYAARFNQPKVIPFLVDAGANVNGLCMEISPLFSAAQFGYTEVVSILLRAGAQVDMRCKDMTPLLAAVMYNQKEVVPLLVTAGANIDGLSNDDSPPMQAAISDKNADMMRLLLIHGAKISPMMAAQIIHSNQTDSLSVLLEVRPEIVNTLKYEGMPLLHMASHVGNLAMVELLIDAGADVNALSDNNETAFMCAIFNSDSEIHSEICARLLEERARIEYQGRKSDLYIETPPNASNSTEETHDAPSPQIALNFYSPPPSPPLDEAKALSFFP